MTQTKLIVLTVKGMTCGGCAEAVKRVIRKADPEADVTVELSSGRVEAKTKAESGPLASAITKAGYDAAVSA